MNGELRYIGEYVFLRSTKLNVFFRGFQADIREIVQVIASAENAKKLE